MDRTRSPVQTETVEETLEDKAVEDSTEDAAKDAAEGMYWGSCHYTWASTYGKAQ